MHCLESVIREVKKVDIPIWDYRNTKYGSTIASRLHDFRGEASSCIFLCVPIFCSDMLRSLFSASQKIPLQPLGVRPLIVSARLCKDQESASREVTHDHHREGREVYPMEAVSGAPGKEVYYAFAIKLRLTKALKIIKRSSRSVWCVSLARRSLPLSQASMARVTGVLYVCLLSTFSISLCLPPALHLPGLRYHGGWQPLGEPLDWMGLQLRLSAGPRHQVQNERRRYPLC